MTFEQKTSQTCHKCDILAQNVTFFETLEFLIFFGFYRSGGLKIARLKNMFIWRLFFTKVSKGQYLILDLKIFAKNRKTKEIPL